MVLWGEQYYWKPSPRTASQTWEKCQICPKHNPESPAHHWIGPCSSPLGNFEIWQLDSFRLPHFCTYTENRYVLAMVFASFPTGQKPFHVRDVDSVAGKTLSEKIIPNRGYPQSLPVAEEPIPLDKYYELLVTSGPERDTSLALSSSILWPSE